MQVRFLPSPPFSDAYSAHLFQKASMMGAFLNHLAKTQRIITTPQRLGFDRTSLIIVPDHCLKNMFCNTGPRVHRLNNS
jgi:hypothetical protein|tara:strand:+ start:20 stop:256 length:237 start_codon:yes stop_codon:yes gene_type:complete